MADIEKYIGESTLTTTPTKKFKLSIKDSSITSSKIADGAVSSSKIANNAVIPEHLSARVRNEVIQPMIDYDVELLQQEINELTHIDAGLLVDEYIYS